MVKFSTDIIYNLEVLYVEACESGRIFEGLLPDNLNIYATTASNAEESSYGSMEHIVLVRKMFLQNILLAWETLYSISWMEDWYATL